MDALVQALRKYLADTGLATTLRECDVTQGEERLLGEEAAQQWTAQHNPRRVDADAFEALYAESMN